MQQQPQHVQRYQKSSYLSCREMLEESAQRCQRAAQELDARIDEINPPYDSAMREIQETEQEIGRVLADFAEKGPEQLLKTQLQYSEQAHIAAPADTPGDSLRNLLRTNQLINEELELQAPNFDTSKANEPFAALRTTVKGLTKRISNIQVTERDI